MGELLIVVPGRDGGRNLFSGFMVVTRDVCEVWEAWEVDDLAGTMVDGVFEPLPLDERRDVDV